MHAVTLKQLEKIRRTIAVRIVQSSGVTSPRLRWT